MENILPIHLQEIIFSSSDKLVSKQLSKLEKAGKIRKIAARIYTPNFTDSPETLVRRNLFTILGRLYPGAVLSHRSALEFQPTTAGHVFLTYTYTKKILLPGITLRFMQGHGRIEGDNPLSGELYASQLERALLENLQPSRQSGPESKTCPLSEVENRLEQVARTRGENGLNELRDKARGIALQLGMEAEFEKLNKLIGAMLASRPSNLLSSPLAMARAFGNPYDPARMELFEKLFVALKQQEFPDLPERNTSDRSFRNFAFFEAYFSNYIEGTEFELEDAMHIIETNLPMPARSEDSHDVLGTYKLVSSREEMRTVPETPTALLDILLYRHKLLLSARSSKNPGQFKDKNNRAGDSFFVDHLLVKGTLIKGFDYYQALTHPFPKAAYMMFLISEVHPFLDGNGRMARVMMNAELVKQGQSKIIIPTVYRDDYMVALRRLTRQHDPAAYLRMLQRAHEFSATIIGEDMDSMKILLEKSNAFKAHDEATLKIMAV
ncbi:MAG: Fic family protein [Saprospiraceae bacterium]|nr:Fic family protein [Saprospiraceae bacterium]